MAKLLLPSTKYIKSNTAALREVYRIGYVSKKEKKDLQKALLLRKDPVTFVKSLRDRRKGIGLKPGQVAHTRYWLIDDDEYIGSLRFNKKLTKALRKREGNIGYQIRPSKRNQGYGTEILRLGLLKAKIHGLKRVYINCGEDNIASKKTIENNGGIFIDRLKDKRGVPATLRYFILIK